MRKFNLSQTLSISALVLAAFVLSGCSAINQNSETLPSPTPVQEQSQEVLLEITGAEAVTETYQMSYVEGESTFDILTRATQENSDLTIDFQEFEFGAFLKSINGYDPSGDNKFWFFEINGVQSEVGISDYTVQSGDQIVFLVETIQ